jgi:hypothetical protein
MSAQVIQLRPGSRADAAPVRTGRGQAARAGDCGRPRGAVHHLPAPRGAHDGPGARPISFETMMVFRHCLGRPWLDMLSHEDQARIAGLVR